MSTKKDGDKASTTSKKKVSSTPKLSTKKREDSSERKKIQKTETSLKPKSKLSNIKGEVVDSSRLKVKGTPKDSPKTEKPVKTPSTSHEPKNIIKTSSSSSKTKIVPSRKPKREAPVTPPSNRVFKTQYFPSKNLYSNALKSDETSKTNPPTVNREKKESKSGSQRDKNKKIPSRVEQMKKELREEKDRSTYRTKTREQIKPKDVSPDTSSVSERPRTATLRKGSIVNDNIVGPDVPIPLVPKIVTKVKTPSPKSEKSDEYNYEDDFESYESDFEAYSSSSSTNLNDISGEETSSISSSDGDENLTPSTNITEKRVSSAGTDEERKLDSGNFDMPDYKYKQILGNIKESVEKENANLKLQDVVRNNPASLSDEGFEEQKSLQFINFLDAKKKCERRKSMQSKRRRGEEILNMIRLDTFSFVLFEMSPVPYETFIKSYGRSNAVQTAVQTGEDDVTEEIQTEEIVTGTRWTQYPVSFSKIDPEIPNYWEIYKNDYLGVGGDNIVEDKSSTKLFNDNLLNKFILSAGNLILKIQTDSNFEINEKVQKNPRELPFSDGQILFNTAQDFLKNCSIQCLSFCCDNKIMTVHLKKIQSADECSSIVCIWNVNNSQEPETYFLSYGHITCCTFDSDSADLMFAGLTDGTISVWDTKAKIFTENISDRIPIYTTEIGYGHNSKVISIQQITNPDARISYFVSNQTKEVCSLDEEGDIILWSIITKQTHLSHNTLNNKNNVVLVKNISVSLQEIYPELIDLQCTDFIVNNENSNYVFVSTNYGFIIHHLIKGGRSNVKKFIPEYKSSANCLEICPFSPNYFVAGFEDGNLNLYSRLVEKPLMVLSDKDGNIDKSSIQIIQWSRNKPFIMYAKDISNTIHIWDLQESDIFPIHSIPFEKPITCMKLSPLIQNKNSQKSYMIVGTDDGNLHLHRLNKDHSQQPQEIYEEHVNTFLEYVSRL